MNKAFSTPSCWRAWTCSEAPASRCASASGPLYRLAENIGLTAVVVTELKLREVQWQILCADMVEATHDAALKQAPEAFDVVRMDFAAHVLALRVTDRTVLVSQRSQIVITGKLIRRDQINLVTHSLADKLIEGGCARIVDNLTDHVTLSTDRPDDRSLTAQAGDVLFLVPVAVFVFSVDTGFVDFHDAHELAEVRVVHGRAQPHAHIPSGLIRRATDLTLNLLGANAFLGIEYLPENLEPHLERVFRVLEDRPADHAEAVVCARLTKPVKRPRDELIDSRIPATRALYDAILPAPLHEELLAGVVGRKGRHQFSERHHAS